MDAGSLHCPNCGAGADPAATRCPYCQARLAAVSCPHCFALMFDAAAFCPHCGTRRTREESAATPLACPGCRQPLRQVTVGATSLLECPGCDGLWIDAARFEQVCADRAAQAAVLHRFPQERPSLEREIHYRPCARCGKLMNRINFGRLSGTIVDVCRAHGTFLDPGELHQIVDFIQQGGLERARQVEIEQLRDERQKLESAQRAAERAAAQARPGARPPAQVDSTAVHDLLRALFEKS
jgi:Zn-finger nucleic acid-binding protein